MTESNESQTESKVDVGADPEVTLSLPDVLREHRGEDDGRCSCGWPAKWRYPDHADHVAAVLSELFVVLPKDQLHRETAAVPKWIEDVPRRMVQRGLEDAPAMHVEFIPSTRWVSDFVPTGEPAWRGDPTTTHLLSRPNRDP